MRVGRVLIDLPDSCSADSAKTPAWSEEMCQAQGGVAGDGAASCYAKIKHALSGFAQGRLFDSGGKAASAQDDNVGGDTRKSRSFDSDARCSARPRSG